MMNYEKYLKYNKKLLLLYGGEKRGQIVMRAIEKKENFVLLYLKNDEIKDNNFKISFKNFNDNDFDLNLDETREYVELREKYKKNPVITIKKDEKDEKFNFNLKIEYGTIIIDLSYQNSDLDITPVRYYNDFMKINILNTSDHINITGVLTCLPSINTVCRNTTKDDSQFFVIKMNSLYTSNKFFTFGFTDKICHNFHQLPKKLFVKSEFNYENSYDLLKKYISDKTERSIKSNLNLLKYIYHNCYNELILELPEDMLYLIKNYENIVFYMILYKMFEKYYDSINKIYENSEISQEIIKNSMKRIDTSTPMIIYLDFINNPPNEYINIDLDNPVTIIYDTGNSTTTIIGMGFIRYILLRLQNTEIYNENTLNIKNLKLPIGTTGIGGTDYKKKYIKINIKLKNENMYNINKEYSFNALIDENPNSPVYNTLLWGHVDLINLFNDGYCIGYNSAKNIYTDKKNNKTEIYNIILKTKENITNMKESTILSNAQDKLDKYYYYLKKIDLIYSDYYSDSEINNILDIIIPKISKEMKLIQPYYNKILDKKDMNDSEKSIINKFVYIKHRII